MGSQCDEIKVWVKWELFSWGKNTFALTFVLPVVTYRDFVSSKVLTLCCCCPPPVGDIEYCFILFYCREGCALGEQSDANKFTLNKDVISLLILSPNFLAAAKIVLHDYISVTEHIDINNLRCKYALIRLPLNAEGHATLPTPLCIHNGIGTCISFQP